MTDIYRVAKRKNRRLERIGAIAHRTARVRGVIVVSRQSGGARENIFSVGSGGKSKGVYFF